MVAWALGATDAMVVMEEMGRGMVLEPLAESLIIAQACSPSTPRAVQARLAARAWPRANTGWSWPTRNAAAPLPPMHSPRTKEGQCPMDTR